MVGQAGPSLPVHGGLLELLRLDLKQVEAEQRELR